MILVVMMVMVGYCNDGLIVVNVAVVIRKIFFYC